MIVIIQFSESSAGKNMWAKKKQPSVVIWPKTLPGCLDTILFRIYWAIVKIKKVAGVIAAAAPYITGVNKPSCVFYSKRSGLFSLINCLNMQADIIIDI